MCFVLIHVPRGFKGVNCSDAAGGESPFANILEVMRSNKTVHPGRQVLPHMSDPAPPFSPSKRREKRKNNKKFIAVESFLPS